MDMEQFLRSSYLWVKPLEDEGKKGKGSAFQAKWAAQAKVVKQLGQSRVLQTFWVAGAVEWQIRDDTFIVENVCTLIHA